MMLWADENIRFNYFMAVAHFQDSIKGTVTQSKNGKEVKLKPTSAFAITSNSDQNSLEMQLSAKL